MDRLFKTYVDGLDRKLKCLLDCEPSSNGLLPKKMPSSGIYLFSEGTENLYIGRSRNIRNRYRMHTRPSAPLNQASFAFLIARDKLSIGKASYKPGSDSRVGLLNNLEFAATFTNSKARVREMEFRFVEETDDTIQALLEIYCAVSLGTKFNKFRTH